MAERRLRIVLGEKRISGAGIILRSTCAEVGWSLELVLVETREEVGPALAAHCPEVALLDLTLLQPDAVTFLSVLHRANRFIPIILFAEPADKECAVQCLAVGARDYLLEEHLDERTVARVLKTVVSGKEKMDPDASVMGEECAFAIRGEGGKAVQSQRDGQAVDGALPQLLQVLRKNVRANDRIVPRWCGQVDLVLADANERCLKAILARLRSRVEGCEGLFLSEHSSVVTVRAGNGEPYCQPLRSETNWCAGGRETCAARLPSGSEGRP